MAPHHTLLIFLQHQTYHSVGTIIFLILNLFFRSADPLDFTQLDRQVSSHYFAWRHQHPLNSAYLIKSSKFSLPCRPRGGNDEEYDGDIPMETGQDTADEGSDEAASGRIAEGSEDAGGPGSAASPKALAVPLDRVGYGAGNRPLVRAAAAAPAAAPAAAGAVFRCLYTNRIHSKLQKRWTDGRLRVHPDGPSVGVFLVRGSWLAAQSAAHPFPPSSRPFSGSPHPLLLPATRP
jgi:hypothetical protein